MYAENERSNISLAPSQYAQTSTCRAPYGTRLSSFFHASNGERLTPCYP